MIRDEHCIGSNRPHYLAGQGHGPTPAHHAYPVARLHPEGDRQVGVYLQQRFRVLPYQGADAARLRTA